MHNEECKINTELFDINKISKLFVELINGNKNLLKV